MEDPAEFGALVQSLATSFTEGFTCLFVPPVGMIKKWADADPSYFTSDEERAKFFAYVEEEFDIDEILEDIDDGESGESDNGEDEGPSFSDVREFIHQSGENFSSHVITKLAPYFLPADGHPAFHEIPDETAESRRERVYRLLHDIIHNYFLGLYTDVDSDANRKILNDITCGMGDDKNEEILQRMVVDNEYAAKAVNIATDTASELMCDSVLRASPGIQESMRKYLVHRAREAGFFV